MASVTYGQVMMFSATSTASMSELKGALSASFSSFAGSAGGSLSQAQKDVLSSSEITVVTLGGSEEGVAQMIKEGNPQLFFNGTTVVTSSVPIAYTLKDLQGNIVKVGESTEYDLTTCHANGFANFYVTNTEGNGTTVAGFFADGSEASLESEMSGWGAQRGIAYDSLNDHLHVLSYTDGVSFIDVYEANGLRPEHDQWEIRGSVSSLTYDPNHARFYATGNFGRGCVLRAFNPNGDDLGMEFCSELADPAAYGEEVQITAHSAAYDTVRDRIYVTLDVWGACYVDDCSDAMRFATVLAFDFQGNEVELSGAFDGVRDPRGIAYDPSLDRIYVSDHFENAVRVYDAEGHRIRLPNPIENLSKPLGLHFDATYNRLYVVSSGSSVITVHEPDGSPAQGLAVPAFPRIEEPHVHRIPAVLDRIQTPKPPLRAPPADFTGWGRILGLGGLRWGPVCGKPPDDDRHAHDLLHQDRRSASARHLLVSSHHPGVHRAQRESRSSCPTFRWRAESWRTFRRR